MLQGSVSTTVEANPELIWQALTDKIEVAELNFPLPAEMSILQRSNDAVLRERVFEGDRIAERVTVDNTARKVTYTLVGHPTFEGYISHQLLRSDNAESHGCILAFTVDWRVKDLETPPEETPDMFELTNDDLFFLRELVERQASEMVPKTEQNGHTDSGDFENEIF